MRQFQEACRAHRIMAAPNFYLREDGGPSLDGVAAQLGISPSYLSRIFQ